MVSLWKWWRIVWAVLRNLIYISVILTGFNYASSHFETLVFCLLVLIFQAVNWTHTTQVRFAVEAEFRARRLLLDMLENRGNHERVSEDLTNGIETYQKQTSLYYINSVGASLIYLIVVWKVISTVFL